MTTAAKVSPIGTPVAEASKRRAARDPKYAELRAAKEPYREVAWLLVKYRMDHGLTQEQLAERVGTSVPQISRIESGRQRTGLDTLQRIAHALNLRMVVGFEIASGDHAGDRELVAI